jgi:hypothetical protein
MRAKYDPGQEGRCELRESLRTLSAADIAGAPEFYTDYLGLSAEGFNLG